jgi:hypothetical protein
MPEGLAFSYRNTGADQEVYVNQQLIGGSVHAEFPHNYLPHLKNNTAKAADCLSSLAVTLRAALKDLPPLSALRPFQNPLERTSLQLRLTSVDTRPKHIEGVLIRPPDLFD